jgi:predicted ATP-grasp superfamily ATP-dependent carboligase
MTEPTVLLTLGRLPKALEVARALRGAGCRVIVAEPFRRHLTGASRAVARSVVVPSPVADREAYLGELAALVAAEGVSLVLPVSEEILHASLLRDRLPAGVRLAAMPHADLLALHDKLSFAAVCRAAGVAVPETFALGDPRAEGLVGRTRTVVKPLFSCSGRGVRFLAAGDALPPADEPALVQEFCAGRVLSTFSLARAGEPRITVTYRGAVMQGTVAVCFERIDTPPAVEAWVGAMLRHTGFDGFISFDLVEDAQGVIRGIECNPRATSGIHFVEPADLAAALLDPQGQRPLRFKPGRLMQQFYPCLTETQRTMFAAGPFRENLRCLFAARDVTWSARDPWPLVSQPWTSWPIIEMAMRRRCTFGEVAMLDLAWGGA